MPQEQPLCSKWIPRFDCLVALEVAGIFPQHSSTNQTKRLNTCAPFLNNWCECFTLLSFRLSFFETLIPIFLHRPYMAAVGIEVGYQTSLVAAPIGGGIEVLLNEYSQRATAYVLLVLISPLLSARVTSLMVFSCVPIGGSQTADTILWIDL
jgi:hypothetical protein